MKRVIFLSLVILICLSNFAFAQSQDALNADKRQHQKYLYLFDPADESSLIKNIDRQGMYDFSVLLKPKTEPAQERYILPLPVSAATVSKEASVSIENGKIYLSIAANSPDEKIVLESNDLNIDTSIYPYFELIYNSQTPLDISLYFFVDIHNDDEVDFIGYFGKEPPEEIRGNLTAYEFNYYIRHNIDLKDKSIKTHVYNDLRIHRADRIFFKLKKIITVITGADEEVNAVINAFNHYNVEAVPKSVFLINYEKAKLDNLQIGSLLDFVKSSPDLKGALSRPLCEYKGKILKLENISDETLTDLLEGRREIKLGSFKLNKNDQFNFKVLENEHFTVEAAYLAEDYKISQREPELIFKRVNPTRYIVDVKAWGSFWLTLNENYHSGWRAYIVENNRKIGEEKFALEFGAKNKGNLILIEGHQVVNAYANGWFVPVDEIFAQDGKPVEFRVVMEFYPQRFYEAGMIISGIAFMIMIIYLLVYGLKKLIKR